MDAQWEVLNLNVGLTGVSGKLDLSDTAARELRAPPRECPDVLREYPDAGPASCDRAVEITSRAMEL